VGATRSSAGSVTLLFQALLLPLLVAERPSQLTLIGGTHVPWSPPVHYLTEVFLPALAPAGVAATVTLHRWGWYPAGGGEITARVAPAHQLQGITIEPTPGAAIHGLSAVSRLPRSIAERQHRQAQERLAAAGIAAEIRVEDDQHALSPGTVVFLAARGRAGFTALGRRQLLAERVADAAVDNLLDWRASRAAVDTHLADQLVPVLALARSRSAYTCPAISPHLRTVAWVVEQFLPVRIALHDGRPGWVEIVPPPVAAAP
jgi:RNA 3'-terminal phosphate cyclase (ATP)